MSGSNSEKGNAKEINLHLFIGLFIVIAEELVNEYMEACLG